MVEKKKNRSHLELVMATQLLGANMPEWIPEYLFCIDRKYRFDFAWIKEKVALEIEGGTWAKGRHTTGKGFEDDCQKYNLGAIRGWRILRATSGMVTNGTALAMVQAALEYDRPV